MGIIKERLIKELMESEVKVGDEVFVVKALVEQYPRSPEQKVLCIVNEILEDGRYLVSKKETGYGDKTVALYRDQFTRDTFLVGANPFPEKPWNSRIRYYNFTLEGILSHIGASGYTTNRVKSDYVVNGIAAKECNFNPFVMKNGEKFFYQRPYCWTLENKQLFIESIYQHMNCGTVLLRERSFEYVDEELKNGNTEVGFADVVDGKQRLSCLMDFVNDGFQDMHGNYYSDLSNYAQHQFRSSQALTLGQMNVGATDEEVIQAFLNINFEGVPMSKEHIEYVKKINEKLIEN